MRGAEFLRDYWWILAITVPALAIVLKIVADRVRSRDRQSPVLILSGKDEENEVTKVRDPR